MLFLCDRCTFFLRCLTTAWYWQVYLFWLAEHQILALIQLLNERRLRQRLGVRMGGRGQSCRSAVQQFSGRVLLG